MTTTFDITPLRSLVAVATTGGVHRAAESLLITQSAVSQHLRKLERESSTTLVVRDGRRIAFTPDGEELLAHARAILSAHDAAVLRFDKHSRSIYRIGTAQNCAGVVLATVMTGLRKSLPDNAIRVHLNRNSTVRDMLTADELDVAVTSRVAPELTARPTGFRLRWLWSPLIEPPTAEAEVPLVVFSPPCSLRQPSFDSWSRAGRRWRIGAEVDDLATGLEAVRSGAGTMLTPVTDRLPDGLHALPDAPPTPAIQLAVVYTERTPVELRDAVGDILAGHVGPDRVETLPSEALSLPLA